MPRSPRLDYPGALHHVIARGIERRRIFRSDNDRLALLGRLADLTLSSQAGLYAWAFMPNHVHVLLRTGRLPLSRFVQRWLGPYATRFNVRHRRSGHLFQNRFKNILVEEEPYLLRLVRYIHLNPVHSRLPVSIDTLDTFPWTGHAVLLGNTTLPAQDTDFILAHFARSIGDARNVYRDFVREGARQPKPDDLDGGGLRRSLGGQWQDVPNLKRGRESWAFDERILGSPEFVTHALQHTGGKRRPPPSEPDAALDAVVRTAARRCGTTPGQLRSPSLQPCALNARALVSHVAVHCFALSLCSTARYLHVSKQSVVRALQRAPSVFARFAISPAELLDSTD